MKFGRHRLHAMVHDHCHVMVVSILGKDAEIEQGMGWSHLHSCVDACMHCMLHAMQEHGFCSLPHAQEL